jgi:hypothetical protein
MEPLIMMTAPEQASLPLVFPDDELPEPYDYREHFWLAKPPYSEDFAAEVASRFEKHTKRWDTNTPIGEAVWTAYRMYHGLGTNLASPSHASPTVSLVETGEYGEFLSLFVNHFRGLLRHQLALVTADRPTWDPQASTSDSESTKEVSLTRNLLDFLMSAKRFDQKLYDQQEMMGVCGVAFQALGWDERMGKRGEPWSTVLGPWECCHEHVREYEDCTYWIFRRLESRWNWAAYFADTDPDKARKIAAYDPPKYMQCGIEDTDPDNWAESDRIPVLYLYAKPTRANPAGRLAITLGEDCVLADGPFPYGEEVTITRACAATFVGTAIPYGNSWSQLPLVDALTTIMSAIMTRLDLFGVPDVTAPDGADFERGAIGGANLLSYREGLERPQLLDLLQIPTVLPNLADMIKKTMEELSGINSVTRGNPSENISSGSMAALVQSMAIQFNSAEERTYTFNLEAVGTHLLNIYKRCATEEQVITIAGQDERWTTKTFVGRDLDNVLRVTVKTASALSKTLPGRKEIADQLLNAKMIQTPQEYLTAIETGNLSPIFRGAVDQTAIIKNENERMSRGEKVVVLHWDHHGLHVRDHLCELNTAARYDPQRRATLEAHLDEHVKTWMDLSMRAPDILEACGCPPLSQAFQVGQAGMMAAGAPPGALPSQVPPEDMPGQADMKEQPGPAPAPRGQEPSQAGPEQPQQSNVPESPV